MIFGILVSDWFDFPNLVIAARAVVVKDVQEGTVVGGDPAKVIGVRSNKNK